MGERPRTGRQKDKVLWAKGQGEEDKKTKFNGRKDKDRKTIWRGEEGSMKRIEKRKEHIFLMLRL